MITRKTLVDVQYRQLFSEYFLLHICESMNVKALDLKGNSTLYPCSNYHPNNLYPK